MRAIALGLLCLAALPCSAYASEVTVEITGSPSIVFNSAIDGCDGDDMPDGNARAFRDASGQIVMFALHAMNRPLRGPDFAHLKVDCHAALASPEDPDPSHYAGRNFVTATWTPDGRHVSALVHEEYHADQYGKCSATGDLGCWYNTVLGYASDDGGLDFARQSPGIVAAAPFRQDVEQGRHRGFFNPSNIFADGPWRYALISTTGWDGQPSGNCVFRTADPARPGSWRAFDGNDFSIRYEDAYKAKPHPKPCMTVTPSPFAIGAIVRHRASKSWIAVFQASAGGAFPIEGFYYTTSHDLLRWSEPKVLLAGKTLYSDLCSAGPSIIAYPSLLDPRSASRNFDEVGDHPDLFFARADVADCKTGQRLLVREGLTIRQSARS